MTRGAIGPTPFRHRLAALVLAALAFGACTARAQCTQSGTILPFEPNPPGVSRPGTLSSGFSNSLAVYRNASGSPRLLMIESWGYSTLDLTNPASPTALKYDDMRLDPVSATTNPVLAFGDAQKYVDTIGISADGQRIVSSMSGPAEPTWHNLVGRPDGGDGFGMWGDYGDSRASGTVVLHLGARYLSFATYSSTPLSVSDVSTLTTVNAEFQSLNLASETTGLPPGSRLSIAGNFILYVKSAGTGIQIIDASTAGPIGNIATGFRTMTLTSVPGDPYGRVPMNYAAAVDPADATKLWVLVEVQGWAPAGENSPSYGLVSVRKDDNGDFQTPVPAGALFRVPSSAGELWNLSGSSASLVASNGQLFAIMWAKRQSPSPAFVLYTSLAPPWAPSATPVSVPLGFDLPASAAAALTGTGTSVYQYIPTDARAFVVPYTCENVLAPGSGGPYAMFVLDSCRLLDTRSPAGPLGGPAIQPAGTPDRSFALGSSCGIPYDARAISANVAVTNVQASGTVSIHRGDGGRTAANTIAVKAGVTRANNSMLQLALDGSGTIRVENRSTGTLDLIIDVNGYFR